MRGCAIARDWGARNFDRMMSQGARNGYAHIRIRARPICARAYTDMMINAAEGDHIEIRDMTIEWVYSCDMARKTRTYARKSSRQLCTC